MTIAPHVASWPRTKDVLDEANSEEWKRCDTCGQEYPKGLSPEKVRHWHRGDCTKVWTKRAL